MLRGCHVYTRSKTTAARTGRRTAWRRRESCEDARCDSTVDEALSEWRRARSGCALPQAGRPAFGPGAHRGTTAAGRGPELQAQMTRQRALIARLLSSDLRGTGRIIGT